MLYFATSDVDQPATLQARAGATGQLLWEHANIAGDVFDVAYHANEKSAALIREFVQTQVKASAPSARGQVPS